MTSGSNPTHANDYYRGHRPGSRPRLSYRLAPVGVWLIGPADDPSLFAEFDATESLRFCQALMRARRGDSVLLTPPRLACPPAARAFGFRPLPPALERGEALVGFGIVSDAATGRAMFRGMPALPMGALAAVAVAPVEQRLNFSLGCYGCREATDLGQDETVLGFPAADLDGVLDALERLRRAAVPRSRAKRAYMALRSGHQPEHLRADVCGAVTRHRGTSV